MGKPGDERSEPKPLNWVWGTLLEKFETTIFRLVIQTRPGGGCTGLCHILGYLFHDIFRIYGYGFQQFLHLPDLWV